MTTHRATPLPASVTFVMWQFPETGGCGRATELLARGLLARGVAVDFISMLPGIGPTDLATVSVFRLTDAHTRPVVRGAANAAGRIGGLALLMMKRVDAQCGRRAVKRRMRKLKRNSVVVFSNVGPKKVLNQSGYRRSARGPIMVGQHHSSFVGAEATGQLREMPQHFGDVDAFVTLTWEDAKLFQQALPVPCSAIPNIATTTDARGVDSCSTVAVALTRYSSEKQLDVMIEAFDRATQDPQLMSWELHLYGAGNLKAELQSFIDHTDSRERIQLHDRTDDISHVLNNAGLNLMTSLYEGFPMAILEASAHSLPTIAFDCSAGVRELVSDSTGALVSAGDVEAYGAALRAVMLDGDSRRAKGVAARQSVEKYSESKVVDQWISLFDACARSRAEAAHE